MELRISAKNLTVSDRFRDYVTEKAGKVEQFAHRPQELNIKITRHEHSKGAGQEDQVELTVYEPGHVVRAEARASDKFAAFDIAFGKLLERLRRYSDKQKKHQGEGILAQGHGGTTRPHNIGKRGVRGGAQLRPSIPHPPPKTIRTTFK